MFGKRDHGYPASSWWGTTTPTTHTTSTTTTYVGEVIRFTIPGRIAGIRFYDDNGGAVPYSSYGAIIDDSFAPGKYVANKGIYIPAGTAAQWHQLWFRPWVQVDTTHDYWVIALYVGGQFYRTNNLLGAPVTRNGITFVNGFQATALDLSTLSPTLNANANAVDVLFYPD